MARFNSNLIISFSPVNPQLNTQAMFDIDYKEPKCSPIDEFLIRLQSINKLAPQPTNFDSYQGQLVLLGVVAAVESYFRAIFRRLIDFDSGCQNAVQYVDVSYGAALHLSKELLPEAILERISFVSKKNITTALKDLLAIKGNLPPELDVTIDAYARVCHLRHCAVHRFGKLGASNAIWLGISEHKSLLEKPLMFDYTALQNVIAIATGLVKTLNNFLFNEMICRVPDSEWVGNYKTDKHLFLKYYKLFSDQISSNRSAQPKKLYLQFNDARIKFSAGRSSHRPLF
jgi:hypothetical protein